MLLTTFRGEIPSPQVTGAMAGCKPPLPCLAPDAQGQAERLSSSAAAGTRRLPWTRRCARDASAQQGAALQSGGLLAPGLKLLHTSKRSNKPRGLSLRRVVLPNARDPESYL